MRSTAPAGELRRLTAFNDALLSEVLLSTPEYMPYTGADDWPMDGWVMKPHDFDPSRKYPLIVEVHGGPATQYGYGFFHEMQLLTAAGYVVLYTIRAGVSAMAGIFRWPYEVHGARRIHWISWPASTHWCRKATLTSSA